MTGLLADSVAFLEGPREIGLVLQWRAGPGAQRYERFSCHWDIDFVGSFSLRLAAEALREQPFEIAQLVAAEAFEVEDVAARAALFHGRAA